MEHIPQPQSDPSADVPSEPQTALMPNVPTIRIELTSSHPHIGKSKICAVIANCLREQIGEGVEVVVLNRSTDYFEVAAAVEANGLEGRVDVERVFLVDFDAHYEEPKPESPLQIFHPLR